jgi:hypothetical protein
MEYLGIVKEVFIPESIDILKSNKIGFKVYVYDLDKEINIIEEQVEYNIDIHKDDEVIVIREDEEYSIILNDGDNDE